MMRTPAETCPEQAQCRYIARGVLLAESPNTEPIHVTRRCVSGQNPSGIVSLMPERAGSAERPLWRTDESHALLVELRRLTDEIVALQGGVVPDELADEWRRIVRSLAQ